MVASPLKGKGKGKGWVQEVDQGEVRGIVCDLCDEKGILCRWGKVSIKKWFFFG